MKARKSGHARTNTLKVRTLAWAGGVKVEVHPGAASDGMIRVLDKNGRELAAVYDAAVIQINCRDNS